MSKQTLSRTAVVLSLGTLRPLPARPLHRIGDVARFVGVETHVIRYWEGEFRLWFGAMQRSKSGQRVYTSKQGQLFATIRDLLYVELYTMDGAKRQLRLAAERLKAG